MRKKILALLLTGSLYAQAQDTFSIVAVDSVSGEVGSAGASCLGSIPGFNDKGAFIISDILPGKGAIHTQSYWNADNQGNARYRMQQGDSPTQIINWLANNDYENNAAVRQYGVVDLHNGRPRAAAYTGLACFDYKNHIVGRYYAIQGNILSGQKVLDSMEARFLRSTGKLEERLMAALQGANMIGADNRCTPFNASSLSAFIRVARSNDPQNNFHLDLYMTYPNNFSGTVPRDPIDSLQTLFNKWKLSSGLAAANKYLLYCTVYYKNGLAHLAIQTDAINYPLELEVFDLMGNRVYAERLEANGSLMLATAKVQQGLFLYTCRSKKGFIQAGKFQVF